MNFISNREVAKTHGTSKSKKEGKKSMRTPLKPIKAEQDTKKITAHLKHSH